MTGSVRHLYVHVPFCAHRCGYCDFVTVVGREGLHGRYVDALLAELDLERAALAQPLETVFLGGGTPTFTEAGELRRLLAGLPSAGEVTVEANPETVTPDMANRLYAAAPEPKTRRWYDSGHRLPADAYKDAAEWVKRTYDQLADK